MRLVLSGSLFWTRTSGWFCGFLLLSLCIYSVPRGIHTSPSCINSIQASQCQWSLCVLSKKDSCGLRQLHLTPDDPTGVWLPLETAGQQRLYSRFNPWRIKELIP